MQVRTRRFVAHFPAPFTLAGVDGQLPAGGYAVDQLEEEAAAGPGDTGRRISMFMHLPTVTARHWTIRQVAVKDNDIATAILVEHEEQADGTDADHTDNGSD